MYTYKKLFDVAKSLSESLKDGGNDNPFKDKWISIVGGVNCATVGRDFPNDDPEKAFDPLNRSLTFDDLWWVQLIRKLGAKLCANLTGELYKITNTYNMWCDIEETSEVVRHEGRTYPNINGELEVAERDQRPDIIIIETQTILEGTLDESLNINPEMPMEGYGDRSLLQLCYKLMDENPNVVIYLMNIGWINGAETLMHKSLVENAIPRYNKRIEEIAHHYQLPLIQIDKLGSSFYIGGSETIEFGILGVKCHQLLARKCYNDMMNYCVT